MAEYINKDEVLSMSYCTNKPTWDNPHLDPKSVVDVEDIESLPAADVVEVVHGKWEFNRGQAYGEPLYFCSVCTDGGSEWGKDKYCPNCGAKMDGDKNG